MQRQAGEPARTILLGRDAVHDHTKCGRAAEAGSLQTLAEVNKRLGKEQAKIKTTTEKVEAQQKTILDLLSLSDEQTEKISKVVQQATYVRDLETRLDGRLDALDRRQAKGRIEVGEWVQRRLAEEAEALREANGDVQQTVAVVRSDLTESAGALQTEHETLAGTVRTLHDVHTAASRRLAIAAGLAGLLAVLSLVLDFL